MARRRCSSGREALTSGLLVPTVWTGACRCGSRTPSGRPPALVPTPCLPPVSIVEEAVERVGGPPSFFGPSSLYFDNVLQERDAYWQALAGTKASAGSAHLSSQSPSIFLGLVERVRGETPAILFCTRAGEGYTGPVSSFRRPWKRRFCSRMRRSAVTASPNCCAPCWRISAACSSK